MRSLEVRTLFVLVIRASAVAPFLVHIINLCFEQPVFVLHFLHARHYMPHVILKLKKAYVLLMVHLVFNMALLPCPRQLLKRLHVLVGSESLYKRRHHLGV
jgi:hypothetical protein